MNRSRTSIVRIAAGAAIIGTLSAAAASTAFADHVHSKQVGNGACVLLAQNGGEGEVDLPFATDAEVEANRAHPLHLLVHFGTPGTNFKIGVVGTAKDPCLTTGDYVND